MFLISCEEEIPIDNGNDNVNENGDNNKQDNNDKGNENNNNQDNQDNNDNETITYSNVFKDPKFLNGFTLFGPSENPVVTYPNKLVTADNKEKPVWELAQWASKYDFNTATRTSGAGQVTFANMDGNKVIKKLAVNYLTGALTMTLNASYEYSHDRKAGESWPHILIQQSWYGNDLVNLSKCDEMIMHIKYKVNSCVDKTISKYDDSLHCGQFVWYITLQNRNESSPDFGQYIWFGINLFDSRMGGKASSEYASQDGGKENNTGAFIYQPGSEKYKENGKISAIGEETEIRFNIIDVAKYAYNLAISRGYLGTTKFEDIYIGSTNFGFEVPGTFDIDATISKIELLYHYK